VNFQGLYAKNKRLHQDNSTWRLLRADNAPVILAFLSELFSDENEVPMNEARVSLDIEIRRLRDIDLWHTENNAAYYLKAWIALGWIRELDDMLTKTDALDMALRFTQGLDSRNVGTSASHLRIVQETVRDFAAATSPNIEDRLSILALKKREIEQEMAALEAGEVVQLTELQQRERIREIFQLAYILPGDFRLVEDEIRIHDQALRVQMIEGDASHGEILLHAMEQEDLLAQTEAGGAFEGFYTLLCDDNRNMELREHLKSILSKPAAQYLKPHERQFLAKLMRELTKESDRVFKVRRRTGEALRAYVESGSAAENRAVTKLISELERVAVTLKEHDVSLRSPTSITLPIDTIKIASPESHRLKMPDDKIDAADMSAAENRTTLSDGMLAVLDTISVKDVAIKVKRTLEQRGPLTVKGLTEYIPIEEGLEELVAHLRVAASVSATRLVEKEDIVLKDKNGEEFKATVPGYLMNAGMFPDTIDELAL